VTAVFRACSPGQGRLKIEEVPGVRHAQWQNRQDLWDKYIIPLLK